MITLPGVDLASFQGTPGQWQGVAGKIAFAGVKFTEYSTAGLYTNPDALADWAALKAAGHGRIAYLFGHASTSASRTVSEFLAVLKPVLATGDAVALDLEVNDSLPPNRVAAWGCDVLAALRSELGRRPLLYTDISFALAGNCAGMAGYPLWISDPSSPAGKPRVPLPWTTWTVHQHVITSPIDRDVARFGSLAGFRAALGKPAPKPKATEDRVQLNTGPGAVTPIAFADDNTKVRFFPGSGDQAELSVEFNGHPTQAVTLSGGAEVVSIPAGADGCRVIRGTAGATVAVSAVTE